MQQQPQTHSNSDLIGWHFTMGGYVQGVGFRPFVFRLAHELGLKGYIENNTGQVSIVVVGHAEILQEFRQRLMTQAPVNARPSIQAFNVTDNEAFSDFSISQSQALANSDIHILPDLATCDDCVNELFDNTNRRYRYPFINCTQCGPRYSIIGRLPYDRVNTSMQAFSLCPACQAEYLNPYDRRFHAEPVACDVCGPSLHFIENNEIGTKVKKNDTAISACLVALQAGDIIAVKGLGGYHLMCDATSTESVARLRERKQRPDKPLAILVTEQRLHEVARPTPEELTLLKQCSRPIVLVKKQQASALANNIALGFNRLGVMLPGNPVQHLLCQAFAKPMVATSANISGEPIITQKKDAMRRLSHLCDGFLHHDRDIVRPADDPVMIYRNHRTQLIRTGRGLSPSEFTLPFSLDKPVLAVGGHIKNTVALAWQNRMVISAHNGDLDNLRSYQTFQQCIEDLQQLYQVKAECIVCDAHPEYNSTHWADSYKEKIHAQGMDCRVTKIPHHHAHASSLLLDVPKSKHWLVFTWDGVGLGTDGQLWGGETFIGQPGDWQRVASFSPFRLPGGEKTAREAWRIASSLCWHADIDVEINNEHLTQLKRQWDKQLNAPTSSAVGRLFSAAAALLGLVQVETFAGHGPMLLEALAETTQCESLVLPFTQDEAGILRIDWQPLVYMLKDNSLSVAQRARCFHETLAECVCVISQSYAERQQDLTIGLSGGVFQNQLLIKLIQNKLQQNDLTVILPSSVPANDGGLCAGQIIEYFYRGQ